MRTVMMVFTMWTMRAGAFRTVFHALLEVLHLFFVEGIELFELFGGQDLAESGHTVNAVFKQCLICFKHLCLGGFDVCFISAFKGGAQSLFGFMLVFAEFLGNGIAFYAASFDGCLLFRRYLQQGIDDFKVRTLEFRALVEVAMRTFVAVLGAVRALAGLSVLFARAGQTLGAVARGVHRAVFARGAFLAAGHFALVAARHAHAAAATAAFKCT